MVIDHVVVPIVQAIVDVMPITGMIVVGGGDGGGGNNGGSSDACLQRDTDSAVAAMQ